MVLAYGRRDSYCQLHGKQAVVQLGWGLLYAIEKG